MILGHLHCFSSPIDCRDNLWKVRWPIQIAILNSSLVCLNHTVNAIAFRLKDVTIQCETVWCSAFCWWNQPTKAVKRNLFICIIVLQNFTNCPYSLQIFISPRITAMKRVAGLSWVTVWQGEIDSDIQVYFTPSKDVFQEVYCPSQVELYDMDLIRFEFQFLCALLEIAQRSKSGAQKFMVAASLRSEEVKLDLLLRVGIAESLCIYFELIPILPSSACALDFWFVNRLVFAWLKLFPNNEEQVAAIWNFSL